MHHWSRNLIGAYLALLQGPVGPLSRGVGGESKVPDGLRYHVLDVWVEELVPVLEKAEEDEAGELLMDAIRSLGREGRGKPLKKRAKESVLEWEKARGEGAADANINSSKSAHLQSTPHASSEDEWDGLGD